MKIFSIILIAFIFKMKIFSNEEKILTFSKTLETCYTVFRDFIRSDQNEQETYAITRLYGFRKD